MLSKPRHRSRLLALALPAVLAGAFLTLAGCGAGADEAAQVYEVRGQVRQLPGASAGAGDSGLLLAHEAIDDFVDREGKVVGMDPMTMSFPVAEGVSLDGVDVNDVVEIELQVDWKGEPAVQVTRVEELPAGTKLVFRAAEPGRGGH